MTRPKIFVTGASGKTGAAVVQELLKKGWPVRASHTLVRWRALDYDKGADGDLVSVLSNRLVSRYVKA